MELITAWWIAYINSIMYCTNRQAVGARETALHHPPATHTIKDIGCKGGVFDKRIVRFGYPYHTLDHY